MTAQIHETKVSMDGLLEVLGKNRYSTPAVAIGELVQNAHDACIRRKLEQFTQKQSENHPTLHITLSVDANNRIIYIEDNGSGLTYNEVIEYLATIGQGYTRTLRDGHPVIKNRKTKPAR
jgi:molecular chaperone HtpG